MDSVTGVTYVSECRGNQISIFNSEGHFMTSFGSGRGGTVGFSNPIGLAVDTSGVLYVCDMGNNRVLMF